MGAELFFLFLSYILSAPHAPQASGTQTPEAEHTEEDQDAELTLTRRAQCTESVQTDRESPAREHHFFHNFRFLRDEMLNTTL